MVTCLLVPLLRYKNRILRMLVLLYSIHFFLLHTFYNITRALLSYDTSTEMVKSGKAVRKSSTEFSRISLDTTYYAIPNIKL